MSSYTDKFWKKEFGNKYFYRNIKKNKNTLRKETIIAALKKNLIKVNTVLEVGAGFGLNLLTIRKYLNPKASLNAVEINPLAHKNLLDNKINSLNTSITNFKVKTKYDLVISRGFLIHLDKKTLIQAVDKMIKSSNKYIYISEYFSDKRRELDYRGNKKLLFLDDYAKYFLKKKYKLKLIDYGFFYKNDKKLKHQTDNENFFIFRK